MTRSPGSVRLRPRAADLLIEWYRLGERTCELPHTRAKILTDDPWTAANREKGQHPFTQVHCAVIGTIKHGLAPIGSSACGAGRAGGGFPTGRDDGLPMAGAGSHRGPKAETQQADYPGGAASGDLAPALVTFC